MEKIMKNITKTSNIIIDQFHPAYLNSIELNNLIDRLDQLTQKANNKRCRISLATEDLSTDKAYQRNRSCLSIMRLILEASLWLTQGKHQQYLDHNPYLKPFIDFTASIDQQGLLTLYQCLTNQDNTNLTAAENPSKDQIKQLQSQITQSIRNYISFMQQPAQQAAIKAYWRSEKDNYHSATSYIDHLFERHAKLLLIRLDFGYSNEVKPYLTYQGVNKHRQQIINYIEQHYPALLGYLWKLEYTPEKSYHLHLLLIFNGNQLKADILIARNIGNHWATEIIQDNGVYYNANQHKKQYAYEVIGNIPRKALQTRENLKEKLISYLVKLDPYIKAHIPAGKRVFGRGEIKAQ